MSVKIAGLMTMKIDTTLAGTLPELLEKLRPGGDRQRTVAVLYLDPDPPEMIL